MIEMMTSDPTRRRSDDRPPHAPRSDGPGDRRGGRSGPPANWGLVFDLGLRMGISVILGVGLGLLADGWFGTRPLLTLVGAALGVGAAMYTIWEVAREAMRK